MARRSYCAMSRKPCSCGDILGRRAGQPGHIVGYGVRQAARRARDVTIKLPVALRHELHSAIFVRQFSKASCGRRVNLPGNGPRMISNLAQFVVAAFVGEVVQFDVEFQQFSEQRLDRRVSDLSEFRAILILYDAKATFVLCRPD